MLSFLFALEFSKRKVFLCTKDNFFPLNLFLFMTDKTDLSGGKMVLLQFHSGAVCAVLTCCHVLPFATS